MTYYLITKTESDMQKLFEITVSYAEKTDMKINAKKSAYSTIFTNSSFSPKIEGTTIPHLKEQQQYKYLGVEISLDLNWSKAISDSMTKYKKVVAKIMQKIYLSTTQKIKLINGVANATPAYLCQFIYLRQTTALPI